MNEGKILPSVSLVVLSWNRRDELIETLESIYNQTYKDIEVIVVDNNSTDYSADIIIERFPQVRLIKLHRNVGCPEGRNIGMKNAKGEIIVSLDDDTILEAEGVEKMLKRLKSEPDLGVVQVKIVNYYTKVPNCPIDQEFYTNLFSGGASAIRREVLTDVGYYPFDFFRQGEEYDLGLRILNSGYNILYYPDVVVYHKVSPKQRNKEEISFLQFRNELKTIWKYYPSSRILIITVVKFFIYSLQSVRSKGILRLIPDYFRAVFNILISLNQRNPLSKETFIKRDFLEYNFVTDKRMFKDMKETNFVIMEIKKWLKKRLHF